MTKKKDFTLCDLSISMRILCTCGILWVVCFTMIRRIKGRYTVLDSEVDIGRQLRTLLDQDGITQKKLAKDLNMSTTTLNGYVKNRRQPDASTMIRLASYFDTTTDFLYGLTTLREPMSSPYNADERQLVHIYRKIPEDKRSLFVETGKTFSTFTEEE